jgi:signal transduction histidine kinase
VFPALYLLSFRPLTQEIERRRQAEGVKEQLLDVLTHELQIPVTTVREGLSQLTEGILGRVTPDQQEALRLVTQDMERLSGLFEQALLAVQLMTGKVAYALQTISVQQLLDDVETTYKAMASEREVRLRVVRPEGPLGVSGDRRWLKEAMGQLIKNAVQVTPTSGTVTLSCAEGLGGVEIVVQDSGPGIPNEELTTLFDSFRWVGGIDNRKTGGLGLGLFIANSIIEANRGKLSVTSAVGEGTRMTARFKKSDASRT